MFYFFNIVIVFYNLLLYTIFRGGIYDYLRLCKMSKNNIKKSRKGLKNYWLYLSIHKQTSLGILYYINIVFLISTIAFSIFTIALGFIKMLQPIVLVFSIAICVIEIPSTMLASIYNYRAEFGKPFVLLARRKYTNKLCSSLIDLFSWGITAFLIYISYLQL